MPNFDSAAMFAKIRDKIAEVLGPDFEVHTPEVIHEDDHQGMIGLVVTNKTGEEVTGEELDELFKAHGGIAQVIGSIIQSHTMKIEVPDSLDDATVGATSPEELNGEYGPHAGDFVRQLALMLAVEWAEALESMENLINHFKGRGMDRDDAEHLTAIAAGFAVDLLKSRQYLGSTLEGYRRDHELTTEQMATVVKSAASLLTGGGFDVMGDGTRAFASSARHAYNEAMVPDSTWPPLHGGSFSHYWEECEGSSC